jgi:hypothetical protein
LVCCFVLCFEANLSKCVFSVRLFRSRSVASGPRSSVSLVDEALKQAEAAQARGLNIFTVLDEAGARKAAQESDERSQKLSLIDGKPVVVKVGFKQSVALLFLKRDHKIGLFLYCGFTD